MEGDLHGVALLAIWLLCACLCYRYGTQPQRVLPTFVIGVVAAHFAGALLLEIGCLFLPITDAGDQSASTLWYTLLTHDWLFLATCLGLTWHFLPAHPALRRGIIGGALLLTTLFTLHLFRLDRLGHYGISPGGAVFSSVREKARCVGPPAQQWHTWMTGVTDGKYHTITGQEVAAMIQMYAIDQGGDGAPVAPPVAQEPVEIGKSLRSAIADWQRFLPRGQHAAWHSSANAVGLLFVIVLTLGCMLRYLPQTFNWWELGLPLFGLALTLLLYWTFKPIMGTYELGPQVLIPAACLGLLGWRLPNRTGLQISVILVFLALTAILALHSAAIRQGVWGKAIYSERGLYNHRRHHSFAEILGGARETLAPVVASDTSVYPAGWLHTLPVWDRVQSYYNYSEEERYYERHSAWHSRLTNLYFIDEYGVWYPGGRLKDALPHMEMRKRDSGHKRLGIVGHFDGF